MNKQPEALRLADMFTRQHAVNKRAAFKNVATELRRLHEVNAELANNKYAPPIKDVIEALRTALAQHREWVGLTNDERAQFWFECDVIADAIEAKLKEKNSD
jgi:aminoglycoside phosphotransferase